MTEENTPTPAPTPPSYDTEIPGGRAVWYKPAELPPRRKRELDVAGTLYAPAINRGIDALDDDDREGSIAGLSDAGKIRLASGMATSDSDVRQMFAMNEVVAWAYLKSWTLTDPLPTSADAILDLARPLYDALLDASAAIEGYARRIEAGQSFEIDPGVEDPASPTGVSAD